METTRKTMMGNSLNTCPVTLMYKDHKNWKPSCPGLPPTRQVIGGHVGVNVHVSETVSDIVEPLANHVRGGKEAVSTEDMVAKVEKLNSKMYGWDGMDDPTSRAPGCASTAGAKNGLEIHFLLPEIFKRYKRSIFF